MPVEYSNVFYFRNINSIGGVESYFYYLVKKYEDLDITVFYENADEKQLIRLKKFVRVKKYNNEKIKCKKIFVNYSSEGILNNTEAEEYIFVIHADYKAQTNLVFRPHEKINRYIAVSKLAAQSFEKVTGIKAEISYNPIIIDKPKKVLNLISATRLTQEKGRDRMILFAKKLDEFKIPYLWTVFTNDGRIINNPNMICLEPKLDITNYIANVDYLVQLSDCEAYCYSVVESLMVGTPVIVTDLPIYKEIGVKNNENGFILDFDLNNVNYMDIYKKHLKFNYKPKKDNYKNILANEKSIYKKHLKEMVFVKVIRGYFDLEEEKFVLEGNILLVNKIRAEELEEKKLIKIL